MGSEANAVQLGNGEVHVVKLDDSCVEMEPMDVVKQSLPLSMPVSPDEGINFFPDIKSPNATLTFSPKLSNQEYYATGSPDAGSPCTPKEGFFDPFAPGHGDFMLAPRSSKYSQEPRSSAARSLNFGSSVKVAIDDDCGCVADFISEEEKLMEIFYAELLEIIVSTQVASFQHETYQDEVLVNHILLNGCKTPEPLLTGIADTCPPAPMKFARKFVNIERGLCRKLDFGH